MSRLTVDQRQGTRTRMLKGGVIAFSGRHATIPCVVRDISETGARLQVGRSTDIPDTFELIVELDGLEVGSEIVWRKPGEVGIRFLEEPRKSAPKRVQVIAPSNPVARATLRRPGPHHAAPAVHPDQSPAHRVQPASPAPRTAHAPSAHAAATSSMSPPAMPSPRQVLTYPATAAISEPRAVHILIAEDDPDDRLLMQDAFAESHYEHALHFVENGVELLAYLRRDPPSAERPRPGLILLDLNMPRMDGRTALRHLKADPSLRRIPVIVLTTSSADEDIQQTYDLGVTAYVAKPSTFEGLTDLVRSLEAFWPRFVSLPAA